MEHSCFSTILVGHQLWQAISLECTRDKDLKLLQPTTLTSVIDSFFKRNSADYHHIVYTFNATLQVENSIFTDNYMQGGEIVSTENSVVSIYSSTYMSNAAGCCNSGALRVGGGTLAIINTIFENNTGDSANSGMKAITSVYSNVSINHSTFANSVFHSNGGIHASESMLLVESCHFSNNSARNSYGGVMNARNSVVTINRSEFINNSASSGGAVNAYNSYLLIETSIFSGNMAETKGGVLTAWRKSIFIANSTFCENIAGNFGGVVDAGDMVNIAITRSMFDSNVASIEDGGALFVYNSSMSISSSAFANNTAGASGGAVKCNDWI